MCRALFILGLTLLLLSGCASSVTFAKSPAKILNGVFSNAASVFLKWLWSLKATNPKTVSVHRPLMIFESGYTVETVFDGSKLGVEPHSVEVLQSGELLILDSENSNIYRISTPLSLYTRPKLVAGSPEGISGHVDGRPREAKLSHPKGMAVDDKGNIYVADTDNMAIRKISESGVTTIVGGKSVRGGGGGRGHIDGPGEDAKLSNDFDVVYIGSSCSLLVVDRGNKAIREVQLHFDDCAYQFGSGFPFGIGVVIAAGISGYILALLQQRAHSENTITDPNSPNQKTSQAEKYQEGFFPHVGNLFSRFIPGFLKPQAFKSQFNDTQRYEQPQQNSYSHTWPTQQDSFEFPEDEPPPPATDTRLPTPKKTYAFMSKDSEKLNQIRQSRVFYNAWENSEQPRQQLRIQQAAFDSHSSHHHHQPSSDKKSGNEKDKDKDRQRRRKNVLKSEDHKSVGQDQGNVNFPRYEY
ncbi:hypothetical protein QQ045_001764 [Rhodiola kirilowii]